MLKPDQPNKMWNARLTSRNFGFTRKWFGGSSVDESVLIHNAELFRSLFEQHGLTMKSFDNQGRYPFYTCEVPNAEMLDVLNSYKRFKVGPEEKLFIEFLNNRENGVKDWLVALPQLVGDAKSWPINSSLELKTVGRTWDPEKQTFGTVASPLDRGPCKKIIGLLDRDPQYDSPDLDEYISRRNLAVLLTYPIHSLNSSKFPVPFESPAIALEYYLPKNGLPMVGYEVMRPDKKNDLVVDLV